jgi:hypothetical protein
MADGEGNPLAFLALSIRLSAAREPLRKVCSTNFTHLSNVPGNAKTIMRKHHKSAVWTTGLGVDVPIRLKL